MGAVVGQRAEPRGRQSNDPTADASNGTRSSAMQSLGAAAQGWATLQVDGRKLGARMPARVGVSCCRVAWRQLNAILVGLLVTVALMVPVAAKLTRSRYLVVEEMPITIASRHLLSLRGNLTASVFRQSLTELAATEAVLVAADATSLTAFVLVAVQFAASTKLVNRKVSRA